MSTAIKVKPSFVVLTALIWYFSSARVSEEVTLNVAFVAHV